ncbi:MAG: KdsC family phosphatase [Geoalkalibacter sp.]|uniref:KdsC family phosphatase n=1 Tax=Geoalkalibacter sp. TaxID=3041440 RepID=UPI002A9C810A|nr:HAD family hydrolase [Thermodesulfobacteriota bacterium]
MQARCRKIRLLLLDVDGVMTDGRIIYDNNGLESKAFNVKDGHGLKLLQRAGVRVGIITGRQSQVVRRRADELGIEIVRQGAKNKIVPYREVLSQLGLDDSEVAYIGDDLVDLPILRRVGFAVAVGDAVGEIKPFVHYVTRADGGRGAVREVCDLILKNSNRWDDVTKRYFCGSAEE